MVAFRNMPIVYANTRKQVLHALPRATHPFKICNGFSSVLRFLPFGESEEIRINERGFSHGTF